MLKHNCKQCNYISTYCSTLKEWVTLITKTSAQRTFVLSSRKFILVHCIHAYLESRYSLLECMVHCYISQVLYCLPLLQTIIPECSIAQNMRFSPSLHDSQVCNSFRDVDCAEYALHVIVFFFVCVSMSLLNVQNMISVLIFYVNE